ncbi:MAG: hypothetical protein AAGF55_00620 [Pseudomonadota bacterium]
MKTVTFRLPSPISKQETPVLRLLARFIAIMGCVSGGICIALLSVSILANMALQMPVYIFLPVCVLTVLALAYVYDIVAINGLIARERNYSQ